jgi:ubiquinone/menaquinone biosynthesis C-methylase UbiE
MTVAAIGAAYQRAAPAWAAGPHRVYAALAAAMWAAGDRELVGARVLDLGAGTGVAGRAALDAGATAVVAVDLAPAMLADLGSGLSPVVGDARALPFAAAAFDVVAAACCLGHLPDPVQALRETRRVSAALVASAFVMGWTHPAKQVVDTELARHGYRAPAWYEQFKNRTEPRVGDPDRLAELARSGGYRDVTVRQIDVDTGVVDPGALAGWRLGMAHIAPWMTLLPPGERRAIHATVTAALDRAPPLQIPLLVLSAR